MAHVSVPELVPNALYKVSDCTQRLLDDLLLSRLLVPVYPVFLGLPIRQQEVPEASRVTSGPSCCLIAGFDPSLF